MSNAEYTPGPWGISKYKDIFPGRIVPLDAYGNTRSDGPICDVLRENEANARLVAAAPDLLEALESILAIRVRGLPLDPAWDAAESAISKAKGEK